MKTIKSNTSINLREKVVIRPTGIHNLAKIISKSNTNPQDVENLYDDSGWYSTQSSFKNHSSLSYSYRSNTMMKEFQKYDDLKDNRGICGISIIIRLCN